MKKILTVLTCLILATIGCSKESGPEKLNIGRVQKHPVVSQGSLGYVWVDELSWSGNLNEIFVGTNQAPNGTPCVYREMLLGKRSLGFVDVRVSDIDFLKEVDRKLSGESYLDQRARKIRQLEHFDLGSRTNQDSTPSRIQPSGLIKIEPWQERRVRDKSRDEKLR